MREYLVERISCFPDTTDAKYLPMQFLLDALYRYRIMIVNRAIHLPYGNDYFPANFFPFLSSLRARKRSPDLWSESRWDYSMENSFFFFFFLFFVGRRFNLGINLSRYRRRRVSRERKKLLLLYLYLINRLSLLFTSSSCWGKRILRE